MPRIAVGPGKHLPDARRRDRPGAAAADPEADGVTSLYELYFGDPGTLGTPLLDMTAEELEVIWE